MCFAGYGKYENQVKTLASQYENVDYLGALPYNKVLEVEADARCISAIYEPVIRNHRLCAPNKFYEALALGKPVIVCENTGIDKLVVKENIGLVIEYNAGAFYNAIRQIKDHPDESKAMGERAREIYLSKYRWSIMADRMLHLYDEILKSR